MKTTLPIIKKRTVSKLVNRKTGPGQSAKNMSIEVTCTWSGIKNNA
ncbi:hypothetical protein [Litoribacter populi]|nr:hypothetical protein [Litoribacter populi]